MLAKHVQNHEFSSRHLVNWAWWCVHLKPQQSDSKSRATRSSRLSSAIRTGSSWTLETQLRKPPGAPDLAYAHHHCTSVLVCGTDDELLAGGRGPSEPGLGITAATRRMIMASSCCWHCWLPGTGPRASHSELHFLLMPWDVSHETSDTPR